MIDKERVLQTIQRAHDYAIKEQYDAGYWFGHLYSNSTVEAEFIMLNYFMGVKDEAETLKLCNRILECQNADGSWGIYYKSPGELSTTVECYFALKLCGIDAGQKARDFILAQGGIEQTRIFTKVWLAMFGQWPWEKLPALPPEIMFLPNKFFINIYELGTWARACIVPASILMVEKPVCDIPASANTEELISHGKSRTDNALTKSGSLLSWRGFFLLTDKLLHWYEKLPWKPGRKRAKEKVLQWVLQRQEADGTWTGMVISTTYSLIALKLLGYDLQSPVIQAAYNGLRKNYTYADKEKNTLAVFITISPIWDTALTLSALVDSALPVTNPVLKKAADFLIKNQILSAGDWQHNNPELPPGGWTFEFANSYYPDIDDTSAVLSALLLYQHKLNTPDAELKQVIDKGVNWLMGMQCTKSGWAAFDRDKNGVALTQLPFFDFGEIIDPPSVDVTAHALEVLGIAGIAINPRIQDAINYVFSEQEDDGSWFGRWGVNYIYGTFSVLTAFHALNFDMNDGRLQKGVQWLLSVQNPDGGWGESCSSYAIIEDKGRGESTPSQTAWALLSLMAGGQVDHPAVAKGINYLCQTQLATGIWAEDYYTACGFAGYLSGKRPQSSVMLNLSKALSSGFMMKYDLYRFYWPLRALGVYLQRSKH